MIESGWIIAAALALAIIILALLFWTLRPQRQLGTTFDSAPATTPSLPPEREIKAYGDALGEELASARNNGTFPGLPPLKQEVWSNMFATVAVGEWKAATAEGRAFDLEKCARSFVAANLDIASKQGSSA